LNIWDLRNGNECKGLRDEILVGKTFGGHWRLNECTHIGFSIYCSIEGRREGNLCVYKGEGMAVVVFLSISILFVFCCVPSVLPSNIVLADARPIAIGIGIKIGRVVGIIGTPGIAGIVEVVAEKKNVGMLE
jgi:hypothetical protein